MDILFTLVLRRSKKMPMETVLYAIISFGCFIGGVYLFSQMIEIIEDYLYDRKLIKHLTRIEEKVDQLPGVRNKEL